MSRFAETLNEIKALSDLEEDWNDEGAPPIAKSSINAALEFIAVLDKKLPVEVIGDTTPSVFPDIHKGIHLRWTLRHYWFSLEFEPNLSDEVGISLVVKRFGKSATWAICNQSHAVKYVVDALRGG